MPEQYPITARTTPARLAERVGYDVDAVAAFLDEALVCHVGYVFDGEPVVLPHVYARIGQALYLHTSTGATLGRLAAAAASDGVPVCVTVSLVDGLVLARSGFHHSLQYRSVVVRGRAVHVTGPDERAAVFAALVDHVVPGRSAQTRPVNAKESAATAVLRVPLVEVSLKTRDGGANDDAEDVDLPHWAGVVPVRSVYGPPQPSPDLAPGVTVPEGIADYRRPSART